MVGIEYVQMNALFLSRGDGSTGAGSAFAPVDFQQWVHCTRPDKKLSNEWPFFSQKMSFSVQKGTSWCKKCGTVSNLGRGITPLP